MRPGEPGVPPTSDGPVPAALANPRRDAGMMRPFAVALLPEDLGRRWGDLGALRAWIEGRGGRVDEIGERSDGAITLRGAMPMLEPFEETWYPAPVEERYGGAEGLAAAISGEGRLVEEVGVRADGKVVVRGLGPTRGSAPPRRLALGAVLLALGCALALLALIAHGQGGFIDVGPLGTVKGAWLIALAIPLALAGWTLRRRRAGGPSLVALGLLIGLAIVALVAIAGWVALNLLVKASGGNAYF